MRQNTPCILVLGASGFVGQTIFSYLSLHFPTLGTTQSSKNKKYYIFRTKNALEDFIHIEKKVKKITHVINCIGVYKESSNEAMKQINDCFPHTLEKMIDTFDFTLIHISTDAVFGKTQGLVFENDKPIPDSIYGETKLAGETTHQKALTIRTSFIGKDADKKKGIIESVISSKQIDGYANQTWSGCTTLQFAKLCKDLIDEKTFEDIRKKTTFVHFTPLPKITKYALIKQITKSTHHLVKVRKVEKEKITRVLHSLYKNDFPFNQFSMTYKKALDEVFP